MNEITIRDKQNAQRGQTIGHAPIERTIHLFLLGMLSVGFVGYFVLQKTWPGLIFAHTAALGIMGFYGCLAGAIAKKKGYSYWVAFRFGFFVPIFLGGIAAFLLVPTGDRSLPLTCGGWFSLFAGIIIVLAYTVIGPRKSEN